jgi:predicted HicB family RNase H-like nuclease
MAKKATKRSEWQRKYSTSQFVMRVSPELKKAMFREADKNGQSVTKWAEAALAKHLKLKLATTK